MVKKKQDKGIYATAAQVASNNREKWQATAAAAREAEKAVSLLEAILELAGTISREYAVRQGVRELWLEAEGQENRKRAGKLYASCNKLRKQRANELRELADSANSEAAAELYRIAIDLEAGKEVYSELCGVAARLGERQTTSTKELGGNTPDGYVAISELMKARPELEGSHSRAMKAVDAANMRTWKPSEKARRLYVNAGDWHNYYANQDRQAFDNLTAEEFLSGAEIRKAAIKKRPNRQRELPEK